MIRKLIQRFQDWAEDGLRGLCGRITPEKRLAVLLTMFVLFAFGSIYIFASAIYNIGKNEGRQIEIEHIKAIELQRADSLKQFNYYNNDRE